MTGPTDFGTIAAMVAHEILFEHEAKDKTTEAQAAMIIEDELRMAWNARGAADIDVFDRVVASQLEADVTHRTNIDLNAVVRAIKGADR